MAAMRRVCALLAASVLAVGCADQLILHKDDALAVLPRHLNANGQFVVDVEINDRGPFVFAIDTGASISVIFENALAEMAIEPSGHEQVVVQGMFESGRYPVVPVDSLLLGGERVHDVRTAALPGGVLAAAGVDGLLGTDVLSRYALAYSHSDQVLRLYAREIVSARAYGGWTAVPLSKLEIGTRGATAYIFNIAIVAQEIPAMFDLGSNANLMNWRAARSLGVRPVRNQRKTRVSGAFGSTSASVELHINHVRIANLHWRHRVFQVVDLPVFEVLGLASRPMAIVGTDFFQKRDFVVDFARQRLLVRTR